MKPILVVVHIYYPNLWPELQGYLKNITVPYDLYVTTTEGNKFLKEDVLKFNPSVHFEIVENRGYDVGPFIHTLNQINLDKYDYLIKLHTKRDIPPSSSVFRGLVANKWRNCCCSFLATKEKFNQYLKAFEREPSLGMQADYHIIVNYDCYDTIAKKEIRKWLKANKYSRIKYAFVAGTMFFARTCLFKEIQNLHLSLTDFDVVLGEKHKTQLAHIFERLFGYFVYKKGYKLADVSVPLEIQKKYERQLYLKEKLKVLIRLFYQKKITASGRLLIKICKIPVYRRKNVSTN